MAVLQGFMVFVLGRHDWMMSGFGREKEKVNRMLGTRKIAHYQKGGDCYGINTLESQRSME